MKLSQIGTFGQHWLNRAANIVTPRNLVMASGAALLSACAVVPKTETVALPTANPTPEPSATSMPGDTTRHRIALLVPMAGNASEVGQALANATTMALLDTNANNLRITTYDTSAGAQSAARQAVVDGNELILGPLLSENVPAVKSAASAAGIPAIAFTNDSTAAGDGVFVMGHIPEQSIRRSVGYARANGSNNFAALLPDGDYGERSFSALQNALGQFGGTLVGFENYAPIVRNAEAVPFLQAHLDPVCMAGNRFVH